MAEESCKEQLQQSGNNRTAHALYASGSIYAATKVGVATINDIKLCTRFRNFLRVQELFAGSVTGRNSNRGQMELSSLVAQARII